MTAPHRWRFPILTAAIAALWLAGAPAVAGEADVIAAAVKPVGGGQYDFDVTIRSNDRGWSYYADRFEVLAPDGTVLGVRELLHPHETEQPFTRELSGVRIPDGIDRVTVRARHRPRGYDGATLVVKVPR
ncbi:MAG: hypothetical protein HY057_06815 [Rhodospirillales bacterium]|nr:hypothetical protein [Rhodospirillales bacterium]